MKTKKATFAEAAKSNMEQRKSYRTRDEQSTPNLKESLGFLMLTLAAGQYKPDDLQLLDSFLRQTYSQRGFEAVESMNAVQRVSE